jgi:hypothetical protein
MYTISVKNTLHKWNQSMSGSDTLIGVQTYIEGRFMSIE